MGAAENMAARLAAQEIIDLASGESTRFVNVNRFWETIAQHAVKQCGCVLVKASDLPAALKPMNDAERVAFEAETMTFGAHKGKRVCAVPLDYLVWVADTFGSDVFHAKVKRYLANEAVQRELEKEEK